MNERKIKVIVSWEEWQPSMWLGSAGWYGFYNKYTKEFSSRPEASGFMQGIKSNPSIRDIREEIIDLDK